MRSARRAEKGRGGWCACQAVRAAQPPDTMPPPAATFPQIRRYNNTNERQLPPCLPRPPPLSLSRRRPPPAPESMPSCGMSPPCCHTKAAPPAAARPCSRASAARALPLPNFGLVSGAIDSPGWLARRVPAAPLADVDGPRHEEVVPAGRVVAHVRPVVIRLRAGGGRGECGGDGKGARAEARFRVDGRADVRAGAPAAPRAGGRAGTQGRGQAVVGGGGGWGVSSTPRRDAVGGAGAGARGGGAKGLPGGASGAGALAGRENERAHTHSRGCEAPRGASAPRCG